MAYKPCTKCQNIKKGKYSILTGFSSGLTDMCSGSGVGGWITTGGGWQLSSKCDGPLWFKKG